MNSMRKRKKSHEISINIHNNFFLFHFAVSFHFVSYKLCVVCIRKMWIIFFVYNIFTLRMFIVAWSFNRLLSLFYIYRSFGWSFVAKRRTEIGIYFSTTKNLNKLYFFTFIYSQITCTHYTWEARAEQKLWYG